MKFFLCSFISSYGIKTFGIKVYFRSKILGTWALDQTGIFFFFQFIGWCRTGMLYHAFIEELRSGLRRAKRVFEKFQCPATPEYTVLVFGTQFSTFMPSTCRKK